MAIDKNEIKKLIEDVDKKSLNLTSEQKNEIAKALADFLKKEKDDNYLGHYTIKQDDVNNKNSLFDDFQKLIDLDSQDSHYLQYIEDIIKDQNNGSHENWNESIKYIVEYFRTHFRPYSQGNEIEVYKYDENGNKIGTQPAIRFSILQDILKANAGYSFKNSPWVMPNINIDEQSYDNVRGADKIKTVLNSQKNMDFTHTQTTGQVDSEGKQKDDGNQVTKYIRLLMPRYTRRVEVEDLNRNFWVIGQVLTAVCAYLFDDDSPIMNMFKRLLNENVQIWENLLYLWAAVSLLGEKDYVPYDSDHIRCEVVYLPNDQWNHEMKFDGYDVEYDDNEKVNSLEKCIDRLSYLIDMYPDKHLCVVPIVRDKNYFKNYYNKEIYYGILCYDRNSNNWTQKIKFNDNGVVIQVETQDKLYYIKEGDGVYPYYEPEATIIEEDNSWIQAIRSYVASFSCDFNNTTFLPKLNINIYDAGKYAITGLKQGIQTVIDYGNNNDYYANPRERYLITNGTNKDLIGVQNNGIYLCELITKMCSPTPYTPEPQPIEGELKFKVVNIGSFFPKDILTHNSGKSFQRITTEQGTPQNKFDIATYGYGCFYIPTSNNDLYKYTSSTPLFFVRNQDLYNNTYNCRTDQVGLNRACEYQNRVDATHLKNWGQDYIKDLYDDGILSNNTIYITRIGVAYWTGNTGTVWNNGIFCDIFIILNGKIEWLCPLYLFDGYWTCKDATFSGYSSGTAWRRLNMFGTGSYTTIGDKTTYTISGTLQWNDHNRESSSSDNRPRCSFDINTANTEKITFNTYIWPNELRDGSTVNPEQMTMRINPNSIWSANKAISSGTYYNFKNTYQPATSGQDGYFCIGGNDATKFYFATRS